VKYSPVFLYLVLLFFVSSCNEQLDISVTGTVTDIDTHEPVGNIKVQMRDGSARGHNAPIPVLTETITNSEGRYALNYTDEEYNSDIECIDNHLVYHVGVADGQGYAPGPGEEVYNLKCIDGHQTVNLEVKKTE